VGEIMLKSFSSRKIWLYLCILIPFLVGCIPGGGSGSGGSGSSGPASQNILLLSDIHFNPFAECTADVTPCPSLEALIENNIDQWPGLLSSEAINNYKEETNNAFLTRGFDNLAPIVASKHVNIVLISGDLLTHDFDTNYNKFAPSQYQNNFTDFCAKTLLYVVQELQKRLPADTKIYVTLGNNDSDIGNYKVQSKAFLNALAIVLAKYVDSNNKANFITSFGSGGYFSVPLSDKLTLIGLNTNSFSTATTDGSASNEQLAWFEGELIKAQNSNKKVILFQHIPYGINLYFAAASGQAVSTLNDNLQAGYLDLLNRYSSVISSVYAGHFHSEFLSLVDGKIPLIGTIAFNSFFGNNPGFKVVNISSEGKFNGYITYFFSQVNGAPMVWTPLYDYASTYGTPAMITLTLKNFPYDFTDPRVIEYRNYFSGGDGAVNGFITEDAKWKSYYCGIKYTDLQGYTECIQGIR
jgi:3',5'-cyclic AMP phosphodiesterase CpdA